MKFIERYRGALLGLAAGDALGTTVEFSPPGTFPPVTEIVGGGPFHLEPGQWTDDTSMALCLADSLIEKRAFDPIDQLERYVRWYREGYLSSRGACFDIGATVRGALVRFEKTREPYCGSTRCDVGGQWFAHAPRTGTVALGHDSLQGNPVGRRKFPDNTRCGDCCGWLSILRCLAGGSSPRDG